MQTGRWAAVVLTLALTVSLAPNAGAQTASEGDTEAVNGSQVDCGPDDGRDRLTPEGFELHFDAPVVAAPEFGITRDQTGETITTWREAKFHFTVDVAPSASASLDLELSWDNPSDFDLYVFGSHGFVIGASDTSNFEEQTTSEQIRGLAVPHCERILVVARSWAGSPGETLDLHIDVEPSSDLLACADDDPAPGCAGKSAGEAPDAVADTRTRLYLAGDPGQASMLWTLNNNDDLPRATLVDERPTSGTPNQYTRPVVGFRDQYRNPFVAHFTGPFDDIRDVVGDVDALVWVSSPTLAEGGTLVVDLYVSGVLVGSVDVPGQQIGVEPTPVRVRFADVDFPQALDVTLQLGTEPSVSSDGAGDPADALFTVHYGSVQFPSRVTLP